MKNLLAVFLVTGLGIAGVQAGNANLPPDVEQTFDRNKGQLYAVYARALRDDPKLGGRVTFQITIDPSGAASDCRIVSSDLREPAVEKKMCEKIKLMKFEPNTASRTVAKTVQFFNRIDLPAN